MLDSFFEFGVNVQILCSVGVMLLCGFLTTRMTKPLHLPNVTGYILAGVAIGPYALHLVPAAIVSGMDFLTDVALSFIAFGVGRYLRIDQLKKSGTRVIALTCFEALVAAAAVTLCMYFVFHLPLNFALLLGAIGSATAPASSLMTIRQYHAKGEFVDTLVQVVAMDDAVALIAFSLCAAAAQGGGGQAETVVLLPLMKNALALVCALALGMLLSAVVNDRRSVDHRLTLTCAAIFLLAAGCAAMGVSPLLACMLLGATYANVRKDKMLFKEVNRFTPPLYVLFFVLSGMRLNLPALATAGIIGVAYFLVRIGGKYLGAYFGARATGYPAPVRRYLGLALIPQAGVSIGLALLAQRLLPEQSGALLSTIILSSSVLYEMIGPACARRALFLSGAIKKENGKLIRPTKEAAQEKRKLRPVAANHPSARWNNAGERLWPLRHEDGNAARSIRK
ncbi:MAG: cation:proton antiporter [Clostridia bacterium]|nr:cation:proton antiporter [Clostridia bacterium]